MRGWRSQSARVLDPSWARAEISWTDGTTSAAGLELGEANEVTSGIATEVAHRLALGQCAPGAYTPAALFGSELAEACSGRCLPDRSR